MITKAETGTTIRAEYFTEYWKTERKVSLSFSKFNLEKAGNIIVVIGIEKKLIKTINVAAIL